MSRAIGSALRQLREAQQISLSRLAQKAGLSKGLLSHAERGNNTPCLRTLEKICATLEIGLARLLSSSAADPNLLLIEDSFIRQVKPFLPFLDSERKKLLLRTLQAAPKIGRREG